MCISYFMFFLPMTFLAVNFLLILDYGNDVRQKANSSNFLIRAQMGHKTAEITCNLSRPHIWPRNC